MSGLALFDVSARPDRITAVLSGAPATGPDLTTLAVEFVALEAPELDDLRQVGLEVLGARESVVTHEQSRSVGELLVLRDGGAQKVIDHLAVVRFLGMGLGVLLAHADLSKQLTLRAKAWVPAVGIAPSLSRKTSAGGGKPHHWSVIGRASVESDFSYVMDPSIAIVGCVAGVALVWKCLTF